MAMPMPGCTTEVLAPLTATIGPGNTPGLHENLKKLQSVFG